jgi:hypothetical protein
MAAKALTELHKNYNNLILSMDLDESYTISPTDSVATIRDKCKIAFKYGAHHYPMLMTYAVSSGMGLDDPSLTSTGLSEGEVGEGIDYPLSGLVGAYNSNLPILKKPLLLKYADDESGLHRDDDDYEATDNVDEADSSTERVRRYYKRHPKKVSKYLKDTVHDRVARNRDRRKAVKKHGKSKMKNHDVHHPTGPHGGSWKLAKKDHGRDKVKECYSPDSIAMDVQQFVTYAAVRLNLQQTPVVSLMPAEDNLTSLGKYDVISNQIFVVVEDRLLADILRTVAHEMAHQKQNEMGYITNPEIDGATGSRIENNANIIAGILLRDYGKIDNSIYISENTIKCRVCGWAWDSKDGGKHPFTCHKCWNEAGRYLMEGGAAGIDYVECQVCMQKLKQIQYRHLSKHNMTVEQYIKLYPSSKLVCENSKNYLSTGKNPMGNAESRKKISHALKGTHKCAHFGDKNGMTRPEVREKFMGNKNPAKTQESRKKISEGVKNSYTDELKKIRATSFKETRNTDEFRERMYELKLWVRPEDKPLRELYNSVTRNLSNLNYQEYFNEIPNAKKRSREWHLDHKISIQYGFDNQIHPAIIAHPCNLEIIHHSLNESKGIKNSLLYEELIELIDRFDELHGERVLLVCGGAAGHLAHPFEDEELTFKDMKQMIDRGLLGGLDQEAPVTEKLDGQNIAFSIRDGQIIFARNKGQVKNRGRNALDTAGIRNMFAGRGNIEKAFTGAAEDLQAAVERLTPEQRQQMFGDGSKFMSLEVILPDTQNVIPYGKSVLVMHGTIEYDEDGNEIGRSNTDGKEFADAVTAVGAEQQQTFGISGPKTIAFSDAETERYQQKAEQYNGRLDRTAQQFGLDENSTLADYRRAWWEQEIQKEMERTGMELSEDEFDGLVRRWADGDKKFGVKNIENDETKKWFRQYEKESLAAAQKKMINPIEMTFLQAGTDSLRRVTNFLSVNNPEASNQLKRDVLEAIKAIRDSNQPDKIAKLQRELERLEAMGIDNIVPSEGVVFIYNGKPYKFTGQFAPINQITGTFKFGMAPPESEEPEEPTDIKSVTDKLQFKPVTKKPVKYSNHGDVEDSSALEDMEPMTFATATSEMKVVTITADGKETENTAVPGDIIMSGPSGEKYVVKAVKFEKLYAKQDDGTVIPEQSPRQVARYTGKDEVTFTAPWGEQMVLKPGDYLVKDGEGYYRVAKKEYEATYNLPGETTSPTSMEPSEPTDPAAPNRTVAIFTGRFQPFHAGHYSIYQGLVERFGKDNVYIASSNVTDPIKSPFAFKEKKDIMTRMFDIPDEMVVQVRNPYAPVEILDKLPPETSYVTAVSQKDADRLGGGKYFRNFDDVPDGEHQGYKDKGYFIVAPEMKLDINGKNISGTQLRAIMGDPNITDRAKQEIFTKIYGKFDPKIFKKIIKTTTDAEEARKLTDMHASQEEPVVKKRGKKKPDARAIGRAKSVLGKKVRNPKTKRDILVATALKYPKDEPVRKAAEKMVQDAMNANESILTENAKSEKLKVYVYVRDYTKDELENEVGEYFKNERTIESFPDLADSAEELKKLILAAPSEVLTKDELELLSNSEVPEVLSSKNPKEVLKKIGTEYKRDVKGILTAIKGQEKLPEPIVIKHSNGYYLLGGNTRLSALAAMRHTMPVKVLQYGAPMVGSVPTTSASAPEGKAKGGKKDLFKKILQMKITNPETGNLIKIDTAMDYDRLHPAHKVAMGVIRQHMRGISNRAGVPKNRTD